MAENETRGTYQLLINKNVVITELNSTPEDGDADMKTSGDADGEHKYYVQEPFDYIFEPDHYPKTATVPAPGPPPPSPAEKIPKNASTISLNGSFIDDGAETTSELGEQKQQSVESTSDELTKEKRAKIDQVELNNPADNSIYKYARVVRESDGVLEYEYKSYSYDRSFYTNKLNDDLDLYYLDYFNTNQAHMNSVIRGVSLSKWPETGFGFTLASDMVNGENLIYVTDIKPDSPAEFSLKLGDILIELDDMNPCEHFRSLDDINTYLNGRENVHLMVVNECNYAKLKAENEDLLKNYHFNCEDIVIVSLNKQLQNSQQ